MSKACVSGLSSALLPSAALIPPSAAPEWLRVGWSFETTATRAPRRGPRSRRACLRSRRRRPARRRGPITRRHPGGGGGGGPRNVRRRARRPPRGGGGGGPRRGGEAPTKHGAEVETTTSPGLHVSNPSVRGGGGGGGAPPGGGGGPGGPGGPPSTVLVATSSNSTANRGVPGSTTRPVSYVQTDVQSPVVALRNGFPQYRPAALTETPSIVSRVSTPVRNSLICRSVTAPNPIHRTSLRPNGTPMLSSSMQLKYTFVSNGSAVEGFGSGPSSRPMPEIGRTASRSRHCSRHRGT